MKKFFTLTLALMATITMWADSQTKTYTFDDDVALTTDWDVTKDIPSGGSADCLITNNLSGSSFATRDPESKYLGLSYLNKSGITISIVSKATYDDIEEIALDVVASDNSKPSFAAYIVTTSGDEVVFDPIGAKDGFNTGGTNKWGSKTVSFPSAKKSGKIKIVTYASSSGKYAAIDNIKVKYTPATVNFYEVRLNPNGGSYASTPEGWDFSEGVYTKSVAEGSFNVPAGLTNGDNDLTGWQDNHGNTITMPFSLDKDTTLVAQWAAHQTSSDATLSALSVAGCTLSPAFASGTTAYTIALPFYASMPVVGAVTATKNDSYAKTPVVSISDNVITVACEAEDGTKKNYTITVNIAPVPTASSSINIEQLVLDYGTSYAIGTALSSAHISYANLNSLDSLNVGDKDNDRPDYNETFLGLKIKKSGGYIQMVIPAGETLKVKFGSVAANLKLTINEVAQTDIDKSTSVYEHTASGNELIKIATSSDKTVVLKQIMVGEDIAVVRPFLATVAPTTNGTASVELPKYAKGEQVTVNYSPASGYQLDNITVSGFSSKGVATNVEVIDGKFTMPGSPVTITVTFSVATALDNTDVNAKAVKRLENGMLVIEKNGKRYNAQGQVVR